MLNPLPNSTERCFNPQVWKGPFGNFANGTYYSGNGCCEPLTAVEVYADSHQVYGLRLYFGGVKKGRMGSPSGKR